MKYNEYYSSDILGRIGITFRGEEKEPESDDEEQIMLYVDVYTLGLDSFLDTTTKYATKNLTPIYNIGLIGPDTGLRFNTIGHYEFSESVYWDTASRRGVARRAGSGGEYYVGTNAASDGTVPFSDIPTIIASNPEVTDSMKLLDAYNDRAVSVDLFNYCHKILAGGRGETIFGLFDRSLYSITNGIGGAWLIPRFDYFTVPTNVPFDVGSIIVYNLPAGKSATSGVRARCVNGTITFDDPQPWVSTTANFPYDLSPINVDNSMSSTLYMWFSVRCLRNIGFICTRKEAENWIDDTSRWLESVGLNKGMIQLYLDSHIEDIPDWYKEKLGI